MVRGALIAITKPTLISTVISHCGIKENIFFCKSLILKCIFNKKFQFFSLISSDTFVALIDNLMELKQIPGVLTERCGSICTYIPQIYLKTQSEWVNNFYHQNGYLEYDALSRVGINDPKSFIAKSIQSEDDLLYLQNCAVGQQLLDQIEATVEEVSASRSWTNILVNDIFIDCTIASSERKRYSYIICFAEYSSHRY